MMNYFSFSKELTSEGPQMLVYTYFKKL